MGYQKSLTKKGEKEEKCEIKSVAKRSEGE
jgi:hypothetical protein